MSTNAVAILTHLFRPWLKKTYRKAYGCTFLNKGGRYIHRQVDHAVIYKPGEI